MTISRPKGTPFPALLKCAHDLADLTGPTVLRHFRTRVVIDNKAAKGQFDPVTKADRAAERVILQALKARYPEHGIVGEEYGTREGAGRYNWVIDPIDGTRAFIMGSPLWGTLIGLLDGGEAVLGLMDQPFTGERFWSGASASYMNKAGGPARKIKTRLCSSLAEATLTTTHPDLFVGGYQQKIHTAFKSAVRMTRYGGDCYNYCLLAAGHVDLIVESGLKPYDIVALIPIIERAGGVITTWDGGAARSGGNIIASGDARIHDAALKLIAKTSQ